AAGIRCRRLLELYERRPIFDRLIGGGRFARRKRVVVQPDRTAAAVERQPIDDQLVGRGWTEKEIPAGAVAVGIPPMPGKRRICTCLDRRCVERTTTARGVDIQRSSWRDGVGASRPLGDRLSGQREKGQERNKNVSTHHGGDIRN